MPWMEAGEHIQATGEPRDRDLSPHRLLPSAQHRPYPLLIDVSQENAVLPVVLLLQGVVPILSLDQAGEGRNQRLSLEWQSCSLGLSWGMYSLLLHCLGVGSQVQGFSDPVADVGALPGTAWEAKDPWGRDTAQSAQLGSLSPPAAQEPPRAEQERSHPGNQAAFSPWTALLPQQL